MTGKKKIENLQLIKKSNKKINHRVKISKFKVFKEENLII